MSQPPEARHQVLLVEDEQDIASVICLHLKDLNADVQHATTGPTGLASAIEGNDWSLIILDLNLPGLDGLRVCEQIRLSDTVSPIMMLTARSTEQERVTGLSSGADYYLTKPFSMEELLAQVGAIFRRQLSNHVQVDQPKPDTIQCGEISIFPDSHRVTIGNEIVSLTAREFELLLYFAKSPGSVFSRQQLLSDVWGYTHKGYMHTVNSHINRLRSKIESDPSNPSYIETIWGVGYRLNQS